MANTRTTNINLTLPEDRAEEWGDVLNSNFTVIDSKMADAYTLASKNFVSSGVYEITGTCTCTDTTLTIPTMRFFSPLNAMNLSGSELPRTQRIATYSYAASDSVFSFTGDSYKRFFFGYKYNGTAWAALVSENLSDFTISDGKGILFGYCVVYKVSDVYKFAPGLTVFKPWFADYSTNDRVLETTTHGTFKGGYISLNGTGAAINLRTNDNYVWAHEGINAYNTVAPHYLNTQVKKDDDSNILFYRACSNSKIDTNELTEYIVLDPTKYWDGEALSAVPSEKYTIQRYCILENSASVVYYGNAYYDSAAEAQSDFALLDNLSTMMVCKEVARIIVKADGTAATVYNIHEAEDTESNDILNMDNFTLYHNATDASDVNKTIKFDTTQGNHKVIVDDLKTQYTIADAAEVRSSGVIPGTLTCSLSGTTYTFNLKVGWVNSDSIVYKTYNNLTWTPSGIATGWKKLLINNAGNLSVDDSSSSVSGYITLAYFYYNNGVSLFSLKPQILTTTPIERQQLTFKPFQIKKCKCVANSSKQIEVEDGTIYSEGINFNNTNANFLNVAYTTFSNIYYMYYKLVSNAYVTGISTETSVQGNYFNGSIITTIPSGKYSIQRVFIVPESIVTSGALSAGYKIMIEYGYNLYDSAALAQAALFDSDEFTSIPVANAIEIGKLITTNGATTITCFYTNQQIYGDLTLTVLDPSEVSRDNPDDEFTIYHSNTSNKYTFDASSLNGEVELKTSATSTTSGAPILLDGLGTQVFTHSATSNGYVGWNGTQYVTKVADLKEFTDTENRLASAGATLNTNLKQYKHVDSDDTTSGFIIPKLHIGTSAPTLPSPNTYNWTLSEIFWLDSTSSPYVLKIWDGVKWQIINSWQ